jgi:hypothetical protein
MYSFAKDSTTERPIAAALLDVSLALLAAYRYYSEDPVVEQQNNRR